MADDDKMSGRCGFFLRRKKRFCKMIPGKGKKYCGEHSYLSEGNESSSGRKRIRCPLDTNHTVFEDKLEKHLKKCNVTKRRQVDYYQANINSGFISEVNFEEKIPLKKIPKSDIHTCIDKLAGYINGDPLQIKTSISVENRVQDEIDKMNSNLSLMKHLQQQSSLIGNLRESELLTSDTIFVELGAGRGMLSHWVQKAVKDQSNVDFLLIDRASARYKADCYHKGPNQGPSFNRIQIDIEHLNLNKVPLISSSQQAITGISKHLCGAATDLALRCLLNTTHDHGFPGNDKSSTSDEKTFDDSRARKKLKLDYSRVKGLLFALCCHHRCSWTSYVGREFLESFGFTSYYFHILCCLSSWATCGSRAMVSKKNSKDLAFGETKESPCVEPGTTTQGSGRYLGKQVEGQEDFSEPCKQSEEHSPVGDEGSCIKALGLSKARSEEIGRQSKLLIDAGRVWYLKKHGLDASLVYYVERSVSLENVALIAWNSSHKSKTSN